MKQIVQNPGSGKLELVDVPVPATAPGLVLVRNQFSVVSPGTEKMAIDFARKSLLGKAREIDRHLLGTGRHHGEVVAHQHEAGRESGRRHLEQLEPAALRALHDLPHRALRSSFPRQPGCGSKTRSHGTSPRRSSRGARASADVS